MAVWSFQRNKLADESGIFIGKGRKRRYVIDKQVTAARLLSYRKKNPITDCWEWTASTNKGYGIIKWNGCKVRVHRLAAWIWLDFDLASPLRVCHRCDNPPCFNPKHFFFGTDWENQLDAIAKGRRPANAVADFQRRKTHCPSGHPLTPDNVYTSEGRRRCATCRKAQTAAQRRKRKCGL